MEEKDDIFAFRRRFNRSLRTEIIGNGRINELINNDEWFINRMNEIIDTKNKIYSILSELPEAFKIKYQSEIDAFNYNDPDVLDELEGLYNSLENVLRFYDEIKLSEKSQHLMNMDLIRLLHKKSNQYPNLFEYNLGNTIWDYYQTPEHYQVWFNIHYNFYNLGYISLINFLTYNEGIVGVLWHVRNTDTRMFLEEYQSRSLEVIENRIKKSGTELRKIEILYSI
jgi:hypothetical protein